MYWDAEAGRAYLHRGGCLIAHNNVISGIFYAFLGLLLMACWLKFLPQAHESNA
jgi:hypothetical protein